MVREVPADQRVDAEILAALLDLIPILDGDRYLLMGRRDVIDKVEEARHFRDRERGIELAQAMEFNAEAVFRERYTQIASKTIKVRATTLFRILKEASVTGESRDELMRRLLRPSVEAAIDDLSPRLSEENEDMLRYSLKEWRDRWGVKEVDARDLQNGDMAVQVLRRHITWRDLPDDLRKYSRYFLKNLFRLNNIHGDNEFFYPPEIIERYWEFISPDQGTFDMEIVPATGRLSLRLYEVSKRFGLERTGNPDYLGLVELLIRDARKRCIKGCWIDVRGWTPEDDEVLKRMMSIEADLNYTSSPNGSGCIVDELSEEGLEEFRLLLRELSGIRAEVRFPVREHDADEQGGPVLLEFNISIDPMTGRFDLDGAEGSERSMHEVVVLIGKKLLDLSRQAYRDPDRFPQPDVEELDAEVHRLMAEAEEEGLTEDMAREIVAKITLLDYYEALARYSFALSEQLVKCMESEQSITFTMPRMLLALLNRVLERKGADEILLERLGD